MFCSRVGVCGLVYVAAAGLVKQKAVTSAATMWAISSWCTPILLVDTTEPTVGSNTAQQLDWEQRQQATCWLLRKWQLQQQRAQQQQYRLLLLLQRRRRQLQWRQSSEQILGRWQQWLGRTCSGSAVGSR
jgi:hypothetical protein